MICKKYFLLSLFCIGSVWVFGQEKSTDQPTSMEPVFPQKDYSPKAKKKSGNSKTTYDARDNFYKRMEAQQKQNIKNEKDGSKSQYADPQYFGHKRTPRKRPVNKMKFCKVCGIRH